MKILFITFGDLSAHGRDIRSVSILRALADAGHQVHVIAPSSDIADHPDIKNLPATTHRLPRWKLKAAVIKAAGSRIFDIVHAVDDAVVFASKVCLVHKIRFVYDARRCFTGSVAKEPFRHWKWFPAYYKTSEKKILGQASRVITRCSALSADLKILCPTAEIVLVEDIPQQSSIHPENFDRTDILQKFDGNVSAILVCSIHSENQQELRKILMAARKVIDSISGAAFFFKGDFSFDAEAMAANLDILSRCSFVSEKDDEVFLSALNVADVSLFFPSPGARYIQQEIYTLLNASAPIVAVEDGSCRNLLSELNSISVLSSSESIAEGLLRAIQEPLFSISLAAEGKKMIAERYSLSSFKHKIRMAYIEVMTKE